MFEKVGACIVNRQNQIVSLGYNGMPRGCKDKNMPWARKGAPEIKLKHMYGELFSEYS
jgi:dCMP deaminase